MVSYLRLNRLEEAKAIYKQAVDKKLDVPPLHQTRFQIAYLEGDSQEMDRQCAWAAGKPGEYNFLMYKAQFAALHGQLKQSRELFQQAFDSAKKFERQSGEATVAGVRATTEYWIGDPAAAKSWAAQSLDLFHDEVVWPAAILALAGEGAKAEKVIAEQSARRPKATMLQQIGIPQVRAALDIKRGNGAAAVEALKASSEFEGADVAPPFYRGLAYIPTKSGKDAAAEFRKVVDGKTFNPLSELHSMAQLELARSLAMAGDAAGARSAYQEMFALWKDADPDLPILKQAKAEYGKLQ